jgi:acid phosphatase type 7
VKPKVLIMSSRTAFSLIAVLMTVCGQLNAADVLVPLGSQWKYLDNGSDQGTVWRSSGFNDGGWAAGPAQLGYGDGDEATVVSYGPDSANKYITTYFRRSFSIADAAAYLSASLRVLRDDGAVVYVNGTEVFRSNMPGGTVGYRTLASAAIDDGTYYTASFSPSLLISGLNVVAVEIHQANATSSDVSFDLEPRVERIDCCLPAGHCSRSVPSARNSGFNRCSLAH